MNQRPEPSFALIIQIHYLQAMLSLGAIPNPMTNEANPVDLESARHELALLDILKKKTEGNLEKEESDILDQIIDSVNESVKNAS
jgi:Domain of unknown function (DUF1844)